MANVKLKKYPRKPKFSASTTAMQTYLKKVREIDSENATRLSLAKRIEKVAGKKKPAAKSKPAKKKSAKSKSTRKSRKSGKRKK